MFSSPNFTIGILSILFIYLPKTESRTAGNVDSTSTNNTGRPFFTEDFISGMKLAFENLVVVRFSLEYILLSHLYACYCGSIIKGHFKPCMQNIALSKETVSDGRPSIIQSLMIRGSPKTLDIWKSDDIGKSFAPITVTQ